MTRITTGAPDTISGQAELDAQHRHAEHVAGQDLPVLTGPDPRLIPIEGLHRLLARLRAIAEEWSPESDRHYAGELAALLPNLSPGKGRELLRKYATAVQCLADYDAMSEPDRRDEWGAEHICERANLATDRDFALAALVQGHPYHPSWRAETTADPYLMADLIAELRAELLAERTEHVRTRRRYTEALDANDGLVRTIDALTEIPVPYVTAHLAVVPDLPAQATP